MRDNYFKRLWHYNKLLCLVLFSFVAIATLLSKSPYNPYSAVVISPFYTWDMFSSPYLQQNNTVAYQLICDGETIYPPAYSDHKKMFYTYTIGKFDHYAQNGYRDDRYEQYQHKLARLHLDTAYAQVLTNAPQHILSYPAWLKSYLSRNLGRELKNIKVYKHYLHYNEQGIQQIDSSVKLLDQ